MNKLKYPKEKKGKKKKAHKKSILQDQTEKYCYLCAVLHNDYTRKQVEDHHIIFGSGRRDTSEAEGLRVNLCLLHHRIGGDAVHNNYEMAELLRRKVQEVFEVSHTREDWMQKVHKNYL